MKPDKIKRQLLRIISLGVVFVFLSAQVFTPEALAARSNAGGGKLEKFSAGDFGKTVGITLGSFVVGCAVGSAIGAGLNSISSGGAAAGTAGAGAGAGAAGTAGGAGAAGASTGASSAEVILSAGGNAMQYAATPALIESLGPAATTTFSAATVPTLSSIPSAMGGAFWKSLSNTFSSASGFGSTMVKGYTTFVAAHQAVRAVSAAGGYYGWSPKLTYLASAVVSGTTAGLLNPSGALGDALGKNSELAVSSMLKGAAAGGLGGLASGGIITAIDGDKIDRGEKIGVTAEIAGMTGAIFATSLARNYFSPARTAGKFRPYKYNEETKTLQEDINQEEVIREFIEQNMYKDILSPPGDKFIPGYLKGAPSLETIPLKGDNILNNGKEIAPADIPDVAEVAKRWTEQGFYEKEATVADVIKAHRTAKLLSSSPDGARTYQISGRAINRIYTLSKEEASLLDTAMLGRDGTLILDFNDPGSYGFKRVVVGAASDTLNQWPLIAGNALALLATKDMDKDKNFQGTFIKGLTSSVGTPLLDSLANVYGLKPAYWGVDQYLGYVPQMENERDEVIKKAAGSKGKMVKQEMWKVIKTSLRYDLPVGIFSSSIQGGLDELIDSDDFTKSMLVSAGGVAASSLARGVVFYANDKFNVRREQEAIDANVSKDKKLDPRAPISNNPQEREMIAQLISDGYLRPIDNRRYEIDESQLFINYWDKDKPGTETREKLVEDIGVINDKYQLALPEIGARTSVAAMNAYLIAAIDGQLAKDIKKKPEEFTKEDYDRYYNKRPDIRSLLNRLGQITEVVRPGAETTDEKKGRRFAANVTLKIDTEDTFVVADKVTTALEAGTTGMGFGKTLTNTIFKELPSGERKYFTKYAPGHPEHNDYGQSLREQEARSKFTLNKEGEIVPLLKFRDKKTGEAMQVFKTAARPSFSTVVLGSLSQGLIEFGWQSFAMGMPYTGRSGMSAYAWHNYSQNLLYNAVAAANRGITDVMAYNATVVGKDNIERASLMAISNLPAIGKKITFNSIATYVPIAGYKGLPFSIVAMIDKGGEHAAARFFQFPYYRLPVVTNDIFAEKRIISIRETKTGEKNGGVNLEEMSNLDNLLKNK